MAQEQKDGMSLDRLWAEILADTGLLETRPDFQFDPAFYAARYPDIADHVTDLRQNFASNGKAEGRIATSYHEVLKAVPDLDQKLAELVIDPRLRAAVDAREEGIFELIHELIALGDPIDRLISDFSQEHYFRLYPDVKAAGVEAFHHFIRFGSNEGRRSLQDVRRNQLSGQQEFDSSKPTCMICLHDFTRSGAPIVGLDLVRKARETHNVIVMGLRPGPLLDSFRELAFTLVVTDRPDEDIDYLHLPAPSQIDFAILNSVEAWVFARYLVRRAIPFANYIHEFTNYIPVGRAIWGALFSDLMVFASDVVRDSWRSIFTDMNFDVERDSIVVAQREMHEGSVLKKEMLKARERVSRLIGKEVGDRRIVYGVGNVEWRKGVDLFVMTAQIARKIDPETLFIWIGDRRNHEDVNFGVWLEKHLLEAEADTPGGNVFFLPAGEYYQDLARAADTLYLPSRLDPLPNVVFDAIRFGANSVLFRNATGFDEETYTRSDKITRVDYGDLVGAAEALLSAPRKKPARLSLKGSKASDSVPNIFPRIAEALHERLAGQRYFVAGSGDYDLPMLYSTREEDRAARLREREKMWSYGRRWIWRSRQHAEAEIAASDNWMHQDVRLERFAWVDAPGLPEYSVHIHAHYLDNLGGDLLYYRALREAKRIVVTTDTRDKVAQIGQISANAGVPVEAIQMPNQGRDILPFLRLFTGGHAREDEIWCHVHQKKSLGVTDAGETWRRFLMAILLGDDTRFSSALDHIANPATGLVTAFDPSAADWDASRRLLPQIAPRLPGPIPEHILLFPVGNMFWTHGSVVANMNAIFGDDYPWPNEPIANDGTVFHLIERLWPAAVTMAERGAVYLDKPDQKRV